MATDSRLAISKPPSYQNNSMTRPTFFILGAPKTGTTSVANWLAQNPYVLFSSIKEPNFFNDDHRNRFCKTLKNYEKLFNGPNKPQCAAIGEASVWYLYSKTAVRNILSYSPNARFVVMIRNPIEMAHSLHDHMVYWGTEPITTFRLAWRAQASRQSGNWVPSCNNEPKQLLYGRVCSVGAQLERLYELIARDRVHVMVSDDLKLKPRHEYVRLLEFLDIPDDNRMLFPPLNESKERLSLGFNRIVRLATSVRDAIGLPIGFGVGELLSNVNRRERLRAPMDATFRSELREYFRGDVNKLAQLINRDLSGWLR